MFEDELRVGYVFGFMMLVGKAQASQTFGIGALCLGIKKASLNSISQEF